MRIKRIGYIVVFPIVLIQVHANALRIVKCCLHIIKHIAIFDKLILYFFEKACGLSGYLLGVNPFDQPGVEAYKKNMFALLGKPGYEDLAKELNQRLNK